MMLNQFTEFGRVQTKNGGGHGTRISRWVTPYYE